MKLRSFSSIAEELNVSRATVQRDYESAMSKIRNNLKKCSLDDSEILQVLKYGLPAYERFLMSQNKKNMI